MILNHSSCLEQEISGSDCSPGTFHDGSLASLPPVRQLSSKQNLREAAANLFRYLRELDQLNLDLIVAEQLPEEGLGAAINDRLRRAATQP